jgi:hypothetical protein
MKVRITFEFDDEVRRALASHYGEKGKASRQTVETWVRGTVDATMQDIMHDARQEEGG